MEIVKIFKDHRHFIVEEKQPSPFHRLEKLTIVPVYSYDLTMLNIFMHYFMY